MSTQPIIIKKVKKGGHGGHHGGSWKVAYADFVTAMMAFFMVMWIMGLSEQTRKSVQGYFNDPIGFMKNEPRSKSVIALSSAASGKPTKGDKAYELEQRAFQKAEQKVESEMARMKGVGDLGKNVKVTIGSEGLQIEMVEAQAAAFFESGSAVIRPAARAIVKHLAPILAASGRPMIVEGHTDAAPFGGPGGNFGLSAARAMAMQEALRADGCPDSQFQGIMGYGPKRLEKPDKPYDFSNRRVTILIPRQAKGDDEPPAQQLKDRLKDGGQPQALDLRPPAVSIATAGARSQTSSAPRSAG